MENQPAPRGLSPASKVLWRTLTQQHRWADHELVAFERALRWFDRADALAAASDKAQTHRDGAALLKSSMDAANTALRHWRLLKFSNGEAARRPGRPSGDDWSAKRKLAAVAAQKVAI
ncbi:MAG: hypothetical protein ABIS29_05130 [Vicinamibacterales bacterium]